MAFGNAAVHSDCASVVNTRTAETAFLVVFGSIDHCWLVSAEEAAVATAVFVVGRESAAVFVEGAAEVSLDYFGSPAEVVVAAASVNLVAAAAEVAPDLDGTAGATGLAS